MHFRKIVEHNIRSAFIKKGGKPTRQSPIYCVLGVSHVKNHVIYKEWFKTPDFIEVPMYESLTDLVSFTYGDSFVENHPVSIRDIRSIHKLSFNTGHSTI